MQKKLATVSKLRLLDRIGKLSKMDMEMVEDATMLQLGLSVPMVEP